MNIQKEAKDHIFKLKTVIEKSGLQSDTINLKDYNYEFNVIDGKTKIKVLVYFGKKGIRTIIQGNENSTLHIKVSDLVNEQQSLVFTKHEFEEPDNYIGSDEAGKGDLFGPLVVAAVHADASILKQFKKIGVRDSKELSDVAINSLASHIKKIGSNKYSIISLEPIVYNKIYHDFKNLNKLLNWAHSKAIHSLLDNNNTITVITDKFSKDALEISGNSAFSNVDFVQIEKGEKYIAVAAASILARNKFNIWFEENNFNGKMLPKGSSDKVNVFIKELEHKLSPDELEKVAKLHFKTAKHLK